MKRLLFPLLLSAALLLGGCQQKAAASASSQSIPENSVTVMGRVSTASGNDFTLALGEYTGGTSTPSGEQGSPDSAPSTADGGQNALPQGEGAPEAPPDGGTDQNTAAAAPPGEASGTGRGSRSSSQAGEGAGSAGAQSGEKPSSGASSTRRFVESGEELSIRIPVGTPILYGSLNVDFSQIQTDYIVSLTYITDSSNNTVVLSAEILST